MIPSLSLTHVGIHRTVGASSVLNIDISCSCLRKILVMQIIINDLRACLIIYRFIILRWSTSSIWSRSRQTGNSRSLLLLKLNVALDVHVSILSHKVIMLF